MRRFVRAIWMRGFGPAAALLVLWAASLWLMVTWRDGGGSTQVTLGNGCLTFRSEEWWWGPPPPANRPLARTTRTGGLPEGWGLWLRSPRAPMRPRFAFELAGHTAEVPLVWAALPLTLPPGLAAQRRSRRVPPGHCPGCRYDRAGLEADVACPECGAVNSERRSP